MDKFEKSALFFLLIIALLPVLLIPADSSAYWIRVLSSTLMLSALVLAQNILLGYTGYPAFGAVAFFGIGGYTTAVMMSKLQLPFWFSFITSGLVATFCALIIAVPLMRLKSHYFAITTLALQLALMELVSNLELTGGSYGINLPIYRGFLESYLFFYLFWSLVFFSYLLNLYIDKSVLGYAFKAIREDEEAAASLGVNTLLFKSLSFAVMALITGSAGSVYAYWITYIDPPSMFDPLLSVKIFVALLIGGIGTTSGPLLGAFFLEIFSELLWSEFPRFHGVLLGILVVITVFLLPRGVLGFISKSPSP